MNHVLINKVSLNSLKKKLPDIKVGHTVRVHQRISEGEKDRVQIFEGLVIKVGSGYGVSKTFMVRKIISGIGVEKIFPLHSGNIEKIDLVKKAKVRSAKLFHMRDLTGKSARLREKYYDDMDSAVVDPKAAKKEEAAQEEEVLTVDPNKKEEEGDTNSAKG